MARSIADIKAEQEALAREAASFEKPQLEEVSAYLTSAPVKAVMEKLGQFASELSANNTAQNLKNMAICFSAAAQSAPVDLNAVLARLSSGPAPAPPTK